MTHPARRDGRLLAAMGQSHGMRETHTRGVSRRERPAMRVLLALIVLARRGGGRVRPGGGGAYERYR